MLDLFSLILVSEATLKMYIMYVYNNTASCGDRKLHTVFQGIVYAVGLLNFPEVEGLWQSFWQGVGLTPLFYKNKLCREYRRRENPNNSNNEDV